MGSPAAANRRMIPGAYETAAGSPGPFDRKTPWGLSSRAASAGVDAGTMVTRQPAATSSRTMLRFIPSS